MTPPPQLSPVLSTATPALTLRERLLRLPGAPVAGPAERQRAEAAVERWRLALERAGPGRFERRLRWDGLDEEQIRAGLYAVEDEAEPAEWALILEEACAAAAAEPVEGDPAVDPADPVPFEEVLLPFVQAARRRLVAAAGTTERVLAPAARAALDRALLRELSGVAGQALLVDFSVSRSRAGGSGISFGFGAPRRTAYLRFVQSMRAAGLAPLVASYPVLARLLAVRAGLWVSTSAELVQRVEADAAALGEHFGGGEPGPVVSLKTGRGETHCAGRTVAEVRFASGLEVMYKPRSMKIDVAFYGLLEWLRGAGLSPDQRILRVLDRDGHGWVEFVRSAPLAGEAEVRDYYERAGALLCLAYLFGTGDLHAGNIIAVGAYPVPIDLETLLMGTPVAASDEAGAPAAPAPVGAPSFTVLNTAMLPHWRTEPGFPRLHTGGLGLQSPEPVVDRRWAFVNTDQMAREDRVRASGIPVNVPRLDGVPVGPREHVDDLVRGFRRCWDVLTAHRAELTSPAGPLARFRGQRVRVLLRDTRIYDAAIRASLHPRHLRDGVDRSIDLERLLNGALASPDRLSYWAAFKAEQHDLDDLDFPYFWCFTDGTVLHDSRGAPVGPFCPVSPADGMLERLARMDERECDRQAALSRFMYALEAAPPATAALAEGAAADAGPLDGATTLAEAREIARALEALAVRDGDGSPRWIGRDGADPVAPNALRLVNERLFDGRAGIALFLAAMDKVGSTGHAVLAAEALLPLRRVLRDPQARAGLAARSGVGAGLGMGGTLYTLTQVGRLTGDAAWLDDARLAAEAITPERIAADNLYEVLGGSAGAALALLSLHDLTGEAWLLDRAVACGTHLLAAVREEPGTGLRAWRPGGGPFTTGFAHGAGGIAAALLRLAGASGRGEFAAAAEAGYRFEESTGSREPAGTGAHGLTRPGHSWAQTWCNGAVGVALGRLLYGGTCSPETVQAAGRWELGSTADHACCGHMGPAELLLVAGEPERALELAGAVVARARAARTYQLAREIRDARLAPAFFQGISGIGYQLLRLTHPQTLPSVLAFR
jgi:type 2 lantibiotic biosynthesis protein LanM